MYLSNYSIIIKVNCIQILLEIYPYYVVVKKKSIEKIEYATIQAEIKNEFIEKQLQFTKSKIEEIRDSIVWYVSV